MTAHCGAKTRSGGRCKKPAGWGTSHPGEGRCRLHGGCSTGPPKGNKNAVKTGEHESILIGALDDEERLLYAQITTDKLRQVDDELRLLTIRELRMLKRIGRLREAGKADMPPGTIDGEEGLVVTGYQKTGPVSVIQREHALGVIQRIEQALTRVQAAKTRLIALKHQIESGGGSLDGTLRELTEAMNRSRKAHG